MIDYITPQELNAQIESKNPNILVIDVRREDEVSMGMIPGAINIPYEKFTQSVIQEKVPNIQDYLIVAVHCMHSQMRGPICAEKLARFYPSRSFTILIVKGGYEGYTKAFPPATKAAAATETENTTTTN